MNRRFISKEELAIYLGVSPNTIRSWVWMRKIPYHKLGGLVKFDLQKVDSWAQERQTDMIK